MVDFDNRSRAAGCHSHHEKGYELMRLDNATTVKVALTLLVGGILGGSSFILIKALVGHISPMQLVAARIGLATLVLVPAMLVLKRTPRLNAPVLRGAGVLALLDAIAPYMLVATAAPYALASTAALLASTMPLFTGVIVSVADRSRLPWEYIAGLMLGAVGVSILAGPRAFDFGSSEMLAMLAVLLSAFCLASSAVYSRSLLRMADPIGLSAVKFAIASVILVPVVTLREGVDGYGDLSTMGWFGLLGIGCITTAIARCGYVWVISKAGSVPASLLTYINPVAALVISYLYIGEVLGSSRALGAAFVCAAVTCVLFGAAISQGVRRVFLPAPQSAYSVEAPLEVR